MRKERGKQRMGKNEEVARKSYSTKEKYKKNSFSPSKISSSSQSGHLFHPQPIQTYNKS